MFAFTPLTVLVLSTVAAARPQYTFASGTACDEMIQEFTTTSTSDATESVGDHGWQDYDGNTCAAGLSTCSNTEGKAVSKSISISFGASATFDVSKAVHAGLDFGVSVAWSTTDSQSTTTSCMASGDDNKPCVCGLQYKVTQQNAKGTWVKDDGCTKSPKTPFDVTSPVLIKGKAKTEWRTCKAAASQCDQMKNSPACADGL